VTEMEPHAAPPPAGPVEDPLPREAERIEQLIDDLRALAPPPVWQRTQEMVQRLVRLYGAGLHRILQHLRELDRLDGVLADRLAGDELVSSLLLLVDLHPFPVGERVRRALDEARPALESYLGPYELVGVEGEVVHLQLRAASAVAAASALSAERLVASALQDAAPEIRRVEIQGLRRPPGSAGEAQLQIDLGRVRAPRPPGKAPP
jgi:Fe-S cluster biogenesis protein NfuA